MSWLYRHLLRPALFIQGAEQIHMRTLRGLAGAGRSPLACRALRGLFGAPELPSEVFGLRFPNPVGLAAGMDKDAEAVPAWAALGFGFTELGAVTWHPQPGNTPPRLFRAIPDEAIINRMGFNNLGAQAVAEHLASWRRRGLWPNHPVGMNLGKSKITPLDKAAEDYASSLRVLLPYLDFFVVNVSSPNTPNLRQLQDKSALNEILVALQEVQAGRLSQPSSSLDSQPVSANSTPLPGQAPPSNSPPKPILVKVAPDLSFEALDEILELVGPRQIAGIVATNTTITRPQTSHPTLHRIYKEAGGLSGRPLKTRSTEVIRHLHRQTRGQLPLIGVGGIFNAEDAWEKIAAGAALLQLYTSLVFEGPGVVQAIVVGLRRRLQKEGMADLRQAIGTAAS